MQLLRQILQRLNKNNMDLDELEHAETFRDRVSTVTEKEEQETGYTH